MQPTDDAVLLRQYAESQSDEAFAALVSRHINLVYSVALRCVGDPHQAEEVAQAVFILLAKKAAQLRHDKALSSWLFQTTRLTASNFIRSETRRHRRELEAHMQSVLDDPGNDLWPRIAPMLDDAVAELNETDRHAIMLRFYEGRNLREVGAALGASEDAAEKRVSRAVEKLRAIFAKRGVTAGASGLILVLSANAVQAAPAGLAVTISTAAALAGTTTATSTTATLLKGVAFVITTKQKIALTAAMALLLAGGATPLLIQQFRKPNPPQPARVEGRERIGIYDSRAIAVAYAGSTFQQRQMQEMRAQLKRATDAGDTTEVARIEAAGQSWQRGLSKQGFGTAPVDDLLAHIADELPKIAEAAGVTRLISKWDQAELDKHPEAEPIDVTMRLVDAFHPNERQLRYAIEIQKKQPENMTR